MEGVGGQVQPLSLGHFCFSHVKNTDQMSRGLINQCKEENTNKKKQIENMQREIVNQVLKILYLVEQPWFPLSPGPPWGGAHQVQPGPQTHISSGRKRWMMAHRARPLRQEVVRSVTWTCW